MLKTMRHHAKYFYVLFFIVILTFVFWGVGTVDKSGDRSSIVAEVGSSKISAEEYWRAYDRMFRFYRDLYKEKFDEEMQKKLKLKETVLDTLIENRVLLAAAKTSGVTVSDDELNEAIKNEQAFMKNGSFDFDVYQNRLKLMRMTPETFEAARRQELTIEKMRRMIELGAIVPDTLGNFKADEQTMKQLTDALQNSARQQAVKAYVDGVKKGMVIKVYTDRLS